jgi:O-methyltransferase
MNNPPDRLNPFDSENPDAQRLRERYFSLLQEVLTNRIYEDPPRQPFGLQDYDPATRAGGRDWPATAHTMIGLKRLANVRDLVERILRERVPGDLLEAGVWRGGACIFMRAILKAYDVTGRRVWVADSFQGLPEPDPGKYPADAGQDFHRYTELAVSLEQVRGNFDKYGLLDDQVAFLQGWFKDTLPGAPIDRLALLRIDGDLYESTSDALRGLYDRVSPGGFVIIDDYHAVEPCRKATDEFRAERGVTDPLEEIDGVGVFWRKTGRAEPVTRGRVPYVSPGPVWKTDTLFRTGGVDFRLTYEISELHAAQSTEDSFVLGKSRQMVEDVLALARQRPIARVLDLGIFKGGSVALYDQVFSPKKLVAIDLLQEPVTALAGYIMARGRAKAVKPYYGINQADPVALGRILATEFPARDIDLIVDDASHFYEETRAAFSITFPYLKPGGLYIIEDWAWAHWAGDFWQKKNPYFGKKRALSNLLIELFMLAASRTDLIQEIVVTCGAITVKRGTGVLPPGNFDIGKHYLLRGKHFEAAL